ncbi:MAG TPA: hypothetical protein VGF12_07135 [Roseateles sp.]|uniref:hypothetical protein n=1 Tax=Roseateles sp. TaxID=1971397 RepID=UPI002ED9D935
MRSTYTYATLEVSRSTYQEIAKLLRDAGYDHAFDAETGAIDMHGIGLLKAEAEDAAYSLDADPAGIRARVAHAITGALMLGAQSGQKPPEGHWLTEFYRMAWAERNEPRHFDIVEEVLIEARRLVSGCERSGIALTVERRPLKPLAMGNEEQVVTVWPLVPRGEGKLWCIHIPGPGEIHAMPNRATANRCAWGSNHAIFKWLDEKQAGQTPEEIAAWPARESVTAVVREWPGTPEEHAAALKAFDPVAWRIA